MTEFKSWQEYRRFRRAVTRGMRYVRDLTTEDFLNVVLATAAKRAITFEPGRVLWRAQLGSDRSALDGSGTYVDDPGPLHPDRMKPIPGRSSEGRANPAGVAHLYLATDPKAAVAEVRPWLGSHVSLGRFEVSKNVNVIKCSASYRSAHSYIEEPEDPAQRERAVWSDIDNAFAEPVTREDDLADYVPTQILAEVFKSGGYDGVMYRSNFAQADNVVLFDLGCARITCCTVVKVTSINVESEDLATGYDVEASGKCGAV